MASPTSDPPAAAALRLFSSYHYYFALLLLCSDLVFRPCGGSRPVHIVAAPPPSSPPPTGSFFTLESVREALTRQEDSIVFCLIERARYPSNAPAYRPSSFPRPTPPGGGPRSLVEFFVGESEAVDAKLGRYQNPEEVPFFPADHLPVLPMPPVPTTPRHFPQGVLYPPSASVNVSKKIWDMYLSELLPLFTGEGDDGNYAATAASDLVCLQALSRRIHYGRFVAEVKYRVAPGDYNPAIQVQDRDALMKLLTDETVEEAVQRRVAKKAMVFGQDVTLNNNNNSSSSSSGSSGGESKYKVDPSVVSRLYGEWVIPLTKLVEVEYLLRRLH